MGPRYEIRELAPTDQDFLWEALYVALWDPPDAPRRPRSVLQNERMRIYAADWGRAGDRGFVAVCGGTPSGAAWARTFARPTTAAGFLDEATPVLAISVTPEHQGTGLGTWLLARLVDRLVGDGVLGMSLSVHRLNQRAVRLYERLGFRPLGPGRGDYIVMHRAR